MGIKTLINRIAAKMTKELITKNCNKGFPLGHKYGATMRNFLHITFRPLFFLSFCGHCFSVCFSTSFNSFYKVKLKNCLEISALRYFQIRPSLRLPRVFLRAKFQIPMHVKLPTLPFIKFYRLKVKQQHIGRILGDGDIVVFMFFLNSEIISNFT